MSNPSEINPTASGVGVGTNSRTDRRAARTRLVIVGNGMVGHKLCERLVAQGGLAKFKIIIFGEERRAAYDRVHLTRYLEGKSPESLELASAAWYAENGIELHLGDPVASIDRKQRIVRSAGAKLDTTGWFSRLAPAPLCRRWRAVICPECLSIARSTIWSGSKRMRQIANVPPCWVADCSAWRRRRR